MSGLSARQKTAYALGGLAMNLTNLVISQWIYKRYVPSPAEAIVPVGLFSLIFFLGRASDAITDPLLATWSDRARTRLGRRIPFILYGLLPLAVVFVLLWLPPVRGLHWANALWAFVFVQAFFILYTVVVTPYLALLPEITSNLSERVDISTLQAVFVMVGTAIFAGIGIVLQRWGWAALGGLVALLTLLSFGPTLLFIREKPLPRDEFAAGEGMLRTLFRWIGMTFKNRPFLHHVLAGSCYWFGLNLLIMLVPYWVQDLLGLDEASVPLLMGPFLGMNLVFFFVFNRLAHRRGKYVAYMICVLGSALLAPALCLVGHLPWGSPLVQSAVLMGLVGIPVAGFMMLPFAILSDIVDYDEQLTGMRREAIYFGVQAILQKTMIGGSIFVFGALVLSGGARGVDLDGLRVVPVVAGVAFVLGFFAFLRYPLREVAGKVVNLRK